MSKRAPGHHTTQEAFSDLLSDLLHKQEPQLGAWSITPPPAQLAFKTGRNCNLSLQGKFILPLMLKTY